MNFDIHRLRGIATLMVVWVHFHVFSPFPFPFKGTIAENFQDSWIGVQVFYAISGYVVFKKLAADVSKELITPDAGGILLRNIEAKSLLLPLNFLSAERLGYFLCRGLRFSLLYCFTIFILPSPRFPIVSRILKHF